MQRSWLEDQRFYLQCFVLVLKGISQDNVIEKYATLCIDWIKKQAVFIKREKVCGFLY
jgi:hypothetical protein